ncbi:MAG TPA: hypothetical protein VGK67_29925 [Myxococcales bacterium]|jgi:hypothetical protein
MPTSKPEKLAAAILTSVRSRENVRVLYATPSEKLGRTSPKVLDGLEKDIGAGLPPEIRAFYSGAEQLGLVWQEDKGQETKEQPAGWNELCDTDGEFWQKALRPSRDYSKRGGMICIPSAVEVFRKGYWIDRIVPEPSDQEIELDGETFVDKVVFEELYPLDFITTYYCAGLWHNRKAGKWRVVLADGNGADWTNYKTMSVAEYFEQLEKGLGGPRTFVSTWGDEPKEIWALRKEE